MDWASQFAVSVEWSSSDMGERRFSIAKRTELIAPSRIDGRQERTRHACVKLVRQFVVSFATRSSLQNARMPRRALQRVRSWRLIVMPEKPSDVARESASIAALLSLADQSDVRPAPPSISSIPAFGAERTITPGRAASPRISSATSTFSWPQRLERAIVTNRNTGWSGKRRTGHCRRATSSITSTGSKTTTGLRTLWRHQEPTTPRATNGSSTLRLRFSGSSR